jgi:murein L,D-transpeptidase YafK
MKVVLRFALIAPLMLGLTGCLNFLETGSTSSSESGPPGERQLPPSTQAQLAIKGMRLEAPIFVRIFKEESEFEVWKLKDGRFQLFKTYPICAWSGTLGPKVQQGDHQAPEGFYTVGRGQMNPHSLYHLSFNIGFPNTYDQANGHSGSALMVHGDCKSAGCYAMTDAYIEEIYILAREAFNGGQTKFHVQAFPFRMTTLNMLLHRGNEWYPFWSRLKEGYDAFEATGKPPIVKVCGKQYLVNVSFPGQASDPAPDQPCPVYAKINPAQMPGIDGVPTTVLASLNKGESPKSQSPAPVVLASSAPQPAPAPQPTVDTALADMSASPVITRPTPTQIATAQPIKPPVTPVYTNTLKPPVSTAFTAPVRMPPETAVQPVTFRTAPFTPPSPAPKPVTVTPAEDPAKVVDPDSIQKPNRSGKGGKLSTPAQTSAADTDGQH